MASRNGSGILVGFVVATVAGVLSVIITAHLGYGPTPEGSKGVVPGGGPPNGGSPSGGLPPPLLPVSSSADPGSLESFRDQVGKSTTFQVTGRTTGRLYGTDLYTDDSDLGTAAVHAGLLRAGERGFLQVTFHGASSGFVGSTRNGLTSLSWSTSWGGSYRIQPVGSATAAPALDVKPDPGTATAWRGELGKVLYFDVIGRSSGNLYGTDLYTDDSEIAAAAVHAGALREGERGTVKVTIAPGASGYPGSTRNGVTSLEWPTPWPGSYRIERAY
jgi:hypothetical protein